MLNQTSRLILAVGAAGVVATGAIFGAQLKSSREAASVPRIAEKAPSPKLAKPDPVPMFTQQVAALENQRANLVTQRKGLEQKLAALNERRATNMEKEARRQAGQEIMNGK